MDTSNPTNILIASLYYLFTVVIAFFSIFSVYVLLRYGKSWTLSLTLSITYSVLFLIMLQLSYRTLQSL